MSTYSEIKTFQKNAAQNDYIDAYVNRRLSAPLSVVFVKLGFSANFVTFLGLLSDLFAVYLMYLSQWVLAGVFVYLSAVIDCCDGEVARYRKSKIKNPKETHFGGYLDEVLGTIGFSLVIFFAGYFMGRPDIGFFAMFVLFMILITALTAHIEFKDKKEIAKNFEKKIFGNLKGRIGFSNCIQRAIITLAVILASPMILLAFGVLGVLFIVLKTWLYRNQ